jgi:hypothetical protein
MKLYHGSNINFDKILFSFAKDKRDFGKGFYATAIKKQAMEWAEALCDRYSTKTAFLYDFSFAETGLKIKTFNNMPLEWLEFVMLNRIKGGLQHKYDVVKGPVANDRTMPTLTGYFDGVYSAKEALKRLRYMKTSNQVSLHTQNALNNLVLIKKIKWTL